MSSPINLDPQAETKNGDLQELAINMGRVFGEMQEAADRIKEVWSSGASGEFVRMSTELNEASTDITTKMKSVTDTVSDHIREKREAGESIS